MIKFYYVRVNILKVVTIGTRAKIWNYLIIYKFIVTITIPIIILFK